MPGSRPAPRRIATLSVHTSPLEQPGTGDAGGMNVYIVESSKRLAARGVEVEIFTRATGSGLPPLVEMSPGVFVRHVTAGPFEGLDKEELPSQLCAFANGVLRAEAAHPPGYYDLIHSHYWLSGQVGWLARERWGVPHVHTAHTLAKVKNKFIAAGDRPEPRARLIGEEQVIAESDRLVANTRFEAQDLIGHYDADPDRVSVVQPGVDLQRFRPGVADRARFGLPERGRIIAFVGRIQPLKAPDVLISALAAMREQGVEDVTVVICGGPSGSGLDRPSSLIELASSLGVSDSVVFLPPQTGDGLAALYRAADLVAVPSYNESFGLVALEAQACGTPVVAAAVGGLVTAVQDGISGVLVDGHDPRDWARVLERLLDAPAFRHRLAAGAAAHASQFSWDRTADNLLRVYRDAVTEHRALIAARLEGATYAW
ncbi:putative glycosyltransferase (forming 1D-myo-inosityl 2-acetamido-2-deoxy-alpha-D-glucopyranoside) [Actinoplanes missouriensis 431]|uniref:D-inositol-3-phosphate glycosyltransferase n=1 Tax=Actinoplanes missouriensis (strain ATCC 14538 / DSM 43046 / CBS 188.64 / JCM 3121 / NBRC 102363 / NCIMB 12654 / NRRL B-3342 / UNCC 431) TaxID=512565 RepID=I0HII7_ACTM4|nr:D-inositol-3-phosphate glycosyltransferase [Actinoplanes missouriensis]BAL92824.1 putative glycosyltransferase (forming 1D-myo-inosityl 2-acetamido-2-deoxy-alpha-D-glucopyranoside) [Actinoplanes missouriensis 431]